MKAITRARFFILLVAVLSLPFISAASASYIKRSPVNNEAPPAARAAAQTAGLRPLLAAAPFQAGAEGLAIYQSDCMTPATDFNLGQTVCAKLTGAPVGSRPTQLLRRVAVVGPDGFIRSKVSVPGDSSTATLTFAIPTTATSLVGGETIDNRGTWQAVALDNSGSPVLRAAFVVTDTAVEVAELALGSAAITAEVAPGSNVIFRVRLVNFGPNAAGNVTVTASEPANTTFVSVTQNPAAPAFTCNTTGGTTTCTTESLPRLDKLSPATNFNIAEFTFTYDVSGAAGPGSAIEHSASVTTETAQRSTRGSLSKASALVNPAAVNVGCELTCPADVVATANTTVGGQPGAFVSYGAASVMGDCGAVINAPTSGSFFPVGTHTITSTSETGGGSCTFLVKVLDTAPPTISCPANISATAPSGSDEATVAVGTPTFTASGGGTVVGERSDSTLAEPKALTDPYPVGITAILWTVTDADGRTARCRQRVTVTANSCGTDTQAPTITAPPDVTVGTGAGNAGCSITLDDDELGQPEVSDNCSVTVAVTGAPAGNNFAPGTYTLTYTATDGAGLTASDTQVVTVVDNTAPIIAAPPDATYTCPSEVPAASPAQARGPVIGPDGLFVRDANGDLVFSGPAFDNCSVNVTVSETHNNGAGSATNPRVITRTYTATDAAGNSSSAVQTITVADGTPPTITAPADVTAYTGPGATYCDAVVNLGSPTAADNCAGVTVTRSPAGNTFPVGTTTVTWTATDAAGNTATATQQVTVIDNTPPVITPPADVVVYLPLNSTATSMAVNYPNPATAFDNCGAPINISYSPASGSVFPVGATTVTITATDSHNNSSTATFTVTVLYNFTGFFSPVNNLPTLNVVQAGRAVPVKFSLSGNKGLDIFAANSPYTVAINCDGSSPQADVAETLTAGGSSLGYTPDQYNYVWKTESSWAGTCRQLVVKLNDGSAHTANFKFK